MRLIKNESPKGSSVNSQGHTTSNQVKLEINPLWPSGHYSSMLDVHTNGGGQDDAGGTQGNILYQNSHVSVLTCLEKYK